MYLQSLLAVLCLAAVKSELFDDHSRTNQLPGRTTIVQLFEWKWKDIADECEKFLGPKGFGGVQISPPSENLIIHLPNGKRPWYERYQVMSYKLETRSGNEDDFLDMTTRCNKVGVRIYADVVINHMTGDHPTNVGTGGSTVDFKNYSYPAVPYTQEHFHSPHCAMNNFQDVNELRNCDLVGLKDLNQTEFYVKQKMADYINNIIKLGVAGIRVDAAKHIWPNDLKEIYNMLHDLNTDFGFAPNTRPYIYQEVVYMGKDVVTPSEYIPLGDVTEFRYGPELSAVFRRNRPANLLMSWGEQSGLITSSAALVFIDNHDTQRSGHVLTYKEPRAYKAAVGFMLAHSYGEPRVMSSYAFEDHEMGPPDDDQARIVSPSINEDNKCGNGWVCEHRWRQIYQMVAFRNVVGNALIQNWWDNGNSQIAFSRGYSGFVAFNVEGTDLDEVFQTGLPKGDYCDIITGERQGNTCTGVSVTVHDKGRARIQIPADAEEMHLAIHVGKESWIPRS